ncbi:MAG: hypothetical protein Q8K67_02685 [Geothrix sp.]|nr:hypothetical protein [Geothrix sp.]
MDYLKHQIGRGAPAKSSVQKKPLRSSAPPLVQDPAPSPPSTILIFIAGILFVFGCRGPVSTRVYSHPQIDGVDARSVQDGDKAWFELTIPHESKAEQWSAIFDNGDPEGLQVLPKETSTQFKWIISPNKVKFLGTPGYGLSVKNSKNSYHMTLT